MAAGQDPNAPGQFVRYLSAKRSIDDRALNRVVLDALREHVLPGPSDRPLRILEIGAGNGTMVERLVEWGLVGRADYVGLDADAHAVADGAASVARWAAARGLEATSAGTSASRVRGPDLDLSVRLVQGDLLRFDPGAIDVEPVDLVIANQFLDLMDVGALLPRLWSWLRPDGFFWFTTNYDGETILEPAIAPELEAQIFALYNRSMDERKRDGEPAGDSRCGRHLFGHLATSGAEILAAGSSDAVVFPTAGRYVRESRCSCTTSSTPSATSCAAARSSMRPGSPPGWTNATGRLTRRPWCTSLIRSISSGGCRRGPPERHALARLSLFRALRPA